MIWGFHEHQERIPCKGPGTIWLKGHDRAEDYRVILEGCECMACGGDIKERG